MRTFATWPRWAVNLLRVVLVRVGVMPRLLYELDLEVWERDVRTWHPENERGWACAPVRGIQ